jgi:hypothetical protein
MTQRQPLGGGLRFMFLVFGCVPTIVGGIGIYAGILPLRESIAARTWVTIPCTMRSSRLIEGHRKSDYSLDFSFSYEFGGQQFVSQRYSFVLGSYEWGAAAVRAHPVGDRGICLVNPADPSQAVIDRAVTSQLLSSAPGPIIFITGGVTFLCLAFNDWRRSARMKGH